jgi:hypothetical protein
MSTTTKSKVPSLPDKGPAASIRYADDLYGWVGQQIELLQAGHVAEIDADNIAEELSDVAHNQYDKLESALRVLLLHFLKWDHQPTHRSRSWVSSVREQRKRIARVLRKNPSLKSYLQEATNEGYEDARDDAIDETRLSKQAFPVECPYEWTAIMTRIIALDDLISPDE